MIQFVVWVRILLLLVLIWPVLLSVALISVLTPIATSAVVRLNAWRHLRYVMAGSWSRSWQALSILSVFGLVVTAGYYFFVTAWENHSFIETFSALVLIFGSFGGWLLYARTEKGQENMKNIFELVDDPAALANFVGQPHENKNNSAAIYGLKPFGDDLPELIRMLQSDFVIGQDVIVADVISLINRRITMQRASKPIAVLLFVGATGSGKTQLAKAIADLIFDKNSLIRFDCNEMTESHSVSQLIGSPPGYLGSEAGGQLTRAIIINRTGVILFDEIEKAHPDVYSTIMGLMDEGRITERSSGQVADASGHLIIMTSNAEHAKIAEIINNITDVNERRTKTKEALSGVFKPEQLARIDEIYPFGQLDRLSMVKIVVKALDSLADEAGLVISKIDTELLIDVVVVHERMQKFGIRELLRVIEKRVVDQMYARKKDGCTEIRIVVNGSDVFVLPAVNERSLKVTTVANNAER